MILSNREIRELALQTDAPMIQPFSEEQLQGASYDVSLSGNLTVLKCIGSVIDPLDDKNISDLYEKKSIGDDGYLLSPGEYVLAELNEMVNIPENLTAHLRPRTRFTRGGIQVADQHCNPTYKGILQVGLFNAGRNPFLLRRGLRVAQMVFEEMKSVPDEDKLYKNKPDAVYHDETEFRSAKWSDEGQKLYSDVMRSFKKGDK